MILENGIIQNNIENTDENSNENKELKRLLLDKDILTEADIFIKNGNYF